jgi:CheY-like chemotaxis protein
MKRIDQIILVDNNQSGSLAAIKNIESAGLAENVKLAVNGEHALLVLDHLDLYKRISGRKIIVILNIDTPIMNGIDFLEGYKWRKYPNKEEILIVVTDNTARENIEKARSLGAKEVISSPLKTSEISEMADKYFTPKMKVLRKNKFERTQMSA